MSQERDSRFAGFARTLWHELMYVHEAGWIDVSDDGMNEEDEQRYRQIIARRAYDLVCHSQQFMPGIENVLDLTEWPE